MISSLPENSATALPSLVGVRNESCFSAVMPVTLTWYSSDDDSSSSFENSPHPVVVAVTASNRAVAAIALVFVVASGALLLARFAPGDYASQFGRDPAEVAAERHRLGLDRPVLEQYRSWLTRSLTLDLGESFEYHRPVT